MIQVKVISENSYNIEESINEELENLMNESKENNMHIDIKDIKITIDSYNHPIALIIYDQIPLK